MLEAKDVARKIAAGCNHSAPIYVPCSNCIESQVAAWESSVREDVKLSVLDWSKNVEADSKRVTDQNKTLLETIGKLRVVQARLEESNKRLAEQLKSANITIADLKLCLDTEQGNKIREAQAARIEAETATARLVK